MWNNSKSLGLTVFCVKAALGLWVVFAFGAPMLVERYILWSHLDQGLVKLFLVTIYLSYLPIFLILLTLNRLLRNLKKGEVFVGDNVTALRMISWSCFFGAVILLGTGFYHWGFILIAGMVGFFGLLMRVIKNILAEALALKNENDYTI